MWLISKHQWAYDIKPIINDIRLKYLAVLLSRPTSKPQCNFIPLSSSCNYLAISERQRPKTWWRKEKWWMNPRRWETTGQWWLQQGRASWGKRLADVQYTFHKADLQAPVNWLIHPDTSWMRTDGLHNRPPSTIYLSCLCARFSISLFMSLTLILYVWCRFIC